MNLIVTLNKIITMTSNYYNLLEHKNVCKKINNLKKIY